jgi:hypothetical protein
MSLLNYPCSVTLKLGLVLGDFLRHCKKNLNVEYQQSLFYSTTGSIITEQSCFLERINYENKISHRWGWIQS